VATAFHKIRHKGNSVRLLIEAAGDPRSRMAAISELGELGHAAMPAVDALLEALKSDAGRNRVGGLHAITIADALRKVSPTNRTAISTLLDRLEETEAPERQNQAAGSMGMTAYGYLAASGKSDRLNIASRLVWLDPAEPHGLEVLVETLHSDPDPGTRAFAAYVLRQAGPGAREAIPALKAALNDKDKAVRRSAASALEKIELPGAK